MDKTINKNSLISHLSIAVIIWLFCLSKLKGLPRNICQSPVNASYASLQAQKGAWAWLIAGKADGQSELTCGKLEELKVCD